MKNILALFFTLNLFVLISLIVQAKYIPQYRYYNTNSTGGSSGPSNVQAGGCTFNGNITNSTIIQLGNCGGLLYYIQLQLGSNKQIFNFQFDTGSNILWVPLQTSNQSGFNSAQSTTYNITNQTMNISYADGSSASGSLGTDIIGIGNTNISTRGLILFANNVSNMNFPTPVSGLVGMGFTPTANFFDLAFNNGQISTNVFSLKLMPNNTPSLLYYNGGLPANVSQNTYWINQYQTNYWQVDVIGMFAGNTQFTSLASDAAIIDSGTSIFLLNSDLYSAVVQKYFSGNGCYQDSQSNVYCPCNSTTSWPTFSFMFIGVQVFIPASAYQQSTGNNSCMANFQNLDDVNSILLGDTFFRQYIVSFDKYNQMIGFYGNTKQIFVFDKQGFLVSQYVMCALMFMLGFVGLGLYILSRHSSNMGRIQSTLGMEMM